ncbi:hypothetical protein IF1G_11132 [Cordyceps javanica]|uniref:Uncharacterized protein n=1 Tax=Cordyceps javanica TaxID=43265 RepID=A0A545UL41_9HYPO|nr:hypothetical protein IF1G_11132 [Cordyceps javanica]
MEKSENQYSQVNRSFYNSSDGKRATFSAWPTSNVPAEDPLLVLLASVFCYRCNPHVPVQKDSCGERFYAGDPRELTARRPKILATIPNQTKPEVDYAR